MKNTLNTMIGLAALSQMGSEMTNTIKTSKPGKSQRRKPAGKLFWDSGIKGTFRGTVNDKKRFKQEPLQNEK